MKRSFGQTGQQQGQSTPTYSAPPTGPQPTAPLPPGPPPPPPAAAPNPYANYGYGGSVAAAQAPTVQAQAQQPNPYPGYGYGGAVPQAYPGYPQPGYSSGLTAPAGYPQPYAPQQPGAVQPQPAVAGATAQNPYGVYGNAQAYAAAVAAAQPQYYAQSQPPQPQQAQPGQQQPLYPSYAQPQPMQYAQPQAPLPPHPQFPSQPGMPSPQGAPPFKRTRYDQQGHEQPQPPPALPPLGSNFPGGVDRGGPGGRGRGGAFAAGPRGGGNMGRGGGPPGGYSHGPPSGPSGDFGGGPPRGSYSNGRGGRIPEPQYASRPGGMSPSYPSRGGSAGPSFAHGLPAPPLSSSRGPSGPSGPRRGPAPSGGGYDRSRPVSGLPGGSGPRPSERLPAYDRAGAGRMADVPKGPRASRPSYASSTGSSAPSVRKDRKWGASGGSSGARDHERTGSSLRESEPKGQLTDFRISGLEVPELEWQWKTDASTSAATLPVEKVEDDPSTVDEDSKEENREAALESVHIGKAPSSPPQADMSFDISHADMSIDTIPADDQPSSVPDLELDPKADVKEESESSEAASKPMTKKQKKAQAAAKRAATLAANKASSQTETPVDGDGAQTGDVEIAEQGSPEVAVEEPKKTLAKHKRDDEEDESVVVDDAEISKAAKKARPDTGEAVKLESVAPNVSPNPSTSTAAAEPDTSLPPSIPKPDLSLPAKPPLPLSERDRRSERGSSAAPTPPVNRENSRLRIYFSSPLTFSTVHHRVDDKDKGQEKEKPKETEKKKDNSSTEMPAESTGESSVVEAKDTAKQEPSANGDQPSAKEQAPSDTAPAKDVSATDAAVGESGLIEHEEDVDGEAVVVDETHRLIPSSSDTDEADEIEIQSALITRPPTGGETEESESTVPAATPAIASPAPEDTPAPTEPESIKAPSEAGTDLEASKEQDAPALPIPPTSPEPSPDRISISYAKNTRRLVIDAETVETLTIFRSEGKIEVAVRLQPALLGEGESATADDLRICHGVVIEAFDAEEDEYMPVSRTQLREAWPLETSDDGNSNSLADPLLPPVHKLLADAVPLLEAEGVTVAPGYNRTTVTFIAFLDRVNPLTEARWVKTGDVEAWITSFSSVPGSDPKKPTVHSKWKGKISVSDPDPPPTIQHALDTWATSSSTGSLADRTSFVANHMSNIDNVFEILLRLTRGDRAGPSHHSAATQPSSVGVLAASLDAPYAEHQTQVSLAVLAMFRLSVETAAKAGIPQKEVEKQVGEIVRGIPHHLIFKSLDGMFREQQKARRR